MAVKFIALWSPFWGNKCNYRVGYSFGAVCSRTWKIGNCSEKGVPVLLFSGLRLSVPFVTLVEWEGSVQSNQTPQKSPTPVSQVLVTMRTVRTSHFQSHYYCYYYYLDNSGEILYL